MPDLFESVMEQLVEKYGPEKVAAFALCKVPTRERRLGVSVEVEFFKSIEHQMKEESGGEQS